jgi:hypothetical protein
MSPIKGISERRTILPRLGKIRVGIKEKCDDDTWHPVPTDHFVCPDEVKKVFGEKPRELSIMFANEDKDQWASQYLRRYSPSLKLLCRGDGRRATVYGDLQRRYFPIGSMAAGMRREIPCDPATCPHFTSGDCRPVMNLQFLLPDCPGFGVYQLDTASVHSMRAIDDTVDFIRSVSPRVAMIPLSLHLVEKEVQPEGCPKTAYVLKLTSRYSVTEIQRYAAENPPGRALLVPMPDLEAPDDLFPRPASDAKPVTPAARASDELVSLYDQATKKVWDLRMQNYQVADFFSKKYQLNVELPDFDQALPPDKFTVENLTAFLKHVESHTRYL